MAIYVLPQKNKSLIPLENGWGTKYGEVVPLREGDYPNYSAFKSSSFEEKLKFAKSHTPQEFYYYDYLEGLKDSIWGFNHISIPINKYVDFVIRNPHGEKSLMISILYLHQRIGYGITFDLNSLIIEADRLINRGIKGAEDLLVQVEKL